MGERILPIHNMAQRHDGLTEATAESFTEAAYVCLDRHHDPPVAFRLQGRGARSDALVKWLVTGSRTRGAWANDTDATEAGAYACVLAAVELVDDMVAVRRAETLTGADFYVGRRGCSTKDLEECRRLEVSGVDKGDEGTVAGRLRNKQVQAARGCSNLPALVGVVGFRACLILMADVR